VSPDTGSARRHIQYRWNSKVSVRDLYRAFELMFPDQVDIVTFDIKKFGTQLKKRIEAKAVAAAGWADVKKRNGGIGSDKGMVWVNLALRAQRAR